MTGYCLGCRLYFLRWWVPDRRDADLDPRPAPVASTRRTLAPGADQLPLSPG